MPDMVVVAFISICYRGASSRFVLFIHFCSVHIANNEVTWCYELRSSSSVHHASHLIS